MTTLSEQQRERLKDLLKEKSLWKVYITSRRIAFSKINIGAGLLVAFAVTVPALRAKSTTVLADQLLVFATMGFSLCIAQLGFLLAGFSFFATVADKEMFCRMADTTHEASGLSYLKYNFLVFMRVFVEYLVFCMACLGLMVLLTKDIGLREAVSEWLGNSQKAKQWITASSFGFFIGCVVYLLMQLASFIYNIYHVVMTSIRWALQKDYETQNASSSVQRKSQETLHSNVEETDDGEHVARHNEQP